jgi:hypothetical protein
MGWNLLLFCIATAAVTAGCLVPNRWLPRLPNDKVLHFASFAVLAVLALPLADGPAEAALWLAGLLGAGWAIECLQSLVPDRNFCWRDIGANAAGIAFGAACTGLYASFATRYF